MAGARRLRGRVQRPRGGVVRLARCRVRTLRGPGVRFEQLRRCASDRRRPGAVPARQGHRRHPLPPLVRLPRDGHRSSHHPAADPDRGGQCPARHPHRSRWSRVDDLHRRWQPLSHALDRARVRPSPLGDPRHVRGQEAGVLRPADRRSVPRERHVVDRAARQRSERAVPHRRHRPLVVRGLAERAAAVAARRIELPNLPRVQRRRQADLRVYRCLAAERGARARRATSCPGSTTPGTTRTSTCRRGPRRRARLPRTARSL